MEIELREMKLEELGMIEQVDRSERVEAKYATESAVDFCLKQGCEVIGLSENSLVRHRSGDPVFAKVL